MNRTIAWVFFLLFDIIVLNFLFLSPVQATDITEPTNFLSCGSDFETWYNDLGGDDANNPIKRCDIEAPITDTSGNPIPISAHPKLFITIPAAQNSSTQPGGTFSIPLGVTTSYKYCSFVKDYNKKFPGSNSYPTALSFHVGADGYQNSPEYSMSDSSPCNDKNTNQSFGGISLESGGTTYGCFTDGACKEVTGGGAVETFGSDNTCSEECGIWQIYDRVNAGTGGPRYVCRTEDNKPPDSPLVNPEQKFYVKSECEAAANEGTQTETNPGSTPTATPKPTDPPPQPPCFTKKTEFNGGDPNNPDDDRRVFTHCYSVFTGLGFPISTSPAEFIQDFFAVLLSLSGGIAILLIIRSGYQLMISRGDAEQVKEARERLTSAIVGLLFIIFSLVILEVIGVDILHIPGLSK